MKHKVIFVLVCLILISGYVGFGVPAILSVDDRYRGELVFNTEQEYTQFKQGIIDSDAVWNKMEVLSSDPPIIVHFSVDVSQDYDLPYGEKSNDGFFWAVVWGAILVFVFIGFYVCLSSPHSKQADQQGG